MHVRVSLKQILLALFTIGLIAAIPFTLSQLRKRQELRQRAAGETVTPLLTPNSATKNVGEAFEAQLSLNASGNDITGVDVRLTTSKDVVEIVSFQPSPTFPNELIKTVDEQTGTLRYVAVNTTANPLTGTVLVGTVTFRAKAQGTSPVTLLGDTQITALGHSGKLPTNPLAASFTVAAPTATPVPTATPTPIPSPTPTIEPTATPTPLPTNTPTPIPTNTPTPSPTPSPTPQPTVEPTETPVPTSAPTATPSPTGEPTGTPIPTAPLVVGDATGEGTVDILDFNVWRDEFLEELEGRTSQRKSNFNKDDTIDILDFNIWRDEFLKTLGL